MKEAELKEKEIEQEEIPEVEEEERLPQMTGVLTPPPTKTKNRLTM